MATPQLQPVVGGAFVMGSGQGLYYASPDEQPMHRVQIQAFELARHETTVMEYYGFAAATGRKFPEDDYWQQDRRPMVYVSWSEARYYTQWLSAVLGRRCSLPSEAQWEYAARANTKGAWHWADDEALAQQRAREFAWYDFPGSLRPALRDGASADGREDGIGFRVACRSHQGFDRALTTGAGQVWDRC